MTTSDPSNPVLDMPELAIGQPVRVYQTSTSSPIWLYDPAAGQPHTELGLVRGEYVDGTVRERRGECYRVTVMVDGVELYVNWMSRYWVRPLDESPAPRYRVSMDQVEITPREDHRPGRNEMTTDDTEPAWRSRYGPQQLRDLLGLTEWQYHRARQTGALPRPDTAAGRWSKKVAQALHHNRIAIRRHAGTTPDVGETRAAEILTERLNITVHPHAVAELARQGLLLVVGQYKDWPLYCGRSLQTWTNIAQVERANIAGERLTADQAATTLDIRRSDFDHLVRLGWITPGDWARGPYTAKKHAPDVPLYRADDLVTLLTSPGIDWDTVRATPKGHRSPLATLPDRTHPTRRTK